MCPLFPIHLAWSGLLPLFFFVFSQWSPQAQKEKLTREKEANKERNKCYKNLRRDQKKKRKRKRNEVTEAAVINEANTAVGAHFLPRGIQEKKRKLEDSDKILPRGKRMVSVALRDAGKHRMVKITKESSKLASSADVTELTNVKLSAGPKSIGSGTFGTCYPGTFRGIPVVIKEYKEKIGQKDKRRSLELLRRDGRHEARVIKQLGDHPGIPLLFGICTKELPVTIVLKFHGNGEESLTIYKAPKNRRITERKEWNSILLETANALEHIHCCGYAHNDLKTNNVVLEKREDERLHPVIIDFGKSVALDKAKIPAAKTAHAKDRCRNTHVAPELVNGTGKPSVASDVFALGHLNKSVFGIVKFENLPIAVENALAELATNRPPISALKVALSADN